MLDDDDDVWEGCKRYEMDRIYIASYIWTVDTNVNRRRGRD